MAAVMVTIYPMTPLITFRQVSYRHHFDKLSFEVETGSRTLIVTARIDENTDLFQMISGLLPPSNGEIQINGQPLTEFTQPQLARFRYSTGIVPTNGGLISNLKLWENITLPLLYAQGNISLEQKEEAYNYLKELNYSGNIMALPAHLTTMEKRIAAFIRGALKKATLMIYSNCFDSSSLAARSSFIKAVNDYHQAEPGRTALFLSTSGDIADELHVDRIIHTH